jgi:hypothetical protein
MRSVKLTNGRTCAYGDSENVRVIRRIAAEDLTPGDEVLLLDEQDSQSYSSRVVSNTRAPLGFGAREQ